MNYVVGFLFNEDRDKVLLIKKINPVWQRDRLNGVGGKIEEWESEYEAMRREFGEEARPREGDADYRPIDWRLFCTLNFQGGKVFFFAAVGDVPIRTKTAEHVDWFAVSDLSALPVIPNLRWLIPMALDVNGVIAQVEDFS